MGLLVAVLAIWFVFFRDTAASSVDSVEAADARAASIAEAASGSDDDPVAADAAGDGETSTDAYDDGEDELDTGQPDSAASIGAGTDGVWTVDTSIGVFNEVCLTEVCGSTFAGFRINEELAGVGAKTVVGRTGDVSGSMELSGSQVIGARFVVDMTTLVTDNPSRTSALKGKAGGLETDTFPEAVFELSEAIDLGELPAEGAQVSFIANGNLTVHGVTNPVAINLTAESQAGLIVVFGSLTDMVLADYDIPKPSAVAVVSVEEIAALELQIFLRR